MSTRSDVEAVLANGPAVSEREQDLYDGARELQTRRSRLAMFDRERLLLTISGGLMSFGLLAIGLGWIGSARATFIEKQIPYLISGGLLGVALSFIGAITFFTYWLTTGIVEARAHEAARAHDHLEAQTRADEREAARARDHAELIAAITNSKVVRNGASQSDRTERPLRRASRSS